MNYRYSTQAEAIFAARRHLDSDEPMPVDLTLALTAYAVDPTDESRIRCLAAGLEQDGAYTPVEHLRDIAFDPEGFTISSH